MLMTIALRLTMAAGLLSATALPAFAATEIQWWHAMTGPNNDVIVKLADDFNKSQSEYKVVPSYKGSYPDTLNAGIAAFRAGSAPHIIQVFEVGTATMMSAKGAIKPVYQLMKDAGEPFDANSYLPAITGYYSTVKGEMLSFPFNSSSMVMWVNLDALKKAGIAAPPKTWPEVFEDAKKLHATSPTCGFSSGYGRGVLGLAQRAHRLEGERARRLRYGARLQHPARGKAVAEPRRAAEG
jgi:sn-glycerol 3-phosphate transport system substrate-binding protein